MLRRPRWPAVYTASTATAGSLAWQYYTYNTRFVPIDLKSDQQLAASLKKISPHNNPPALVDHARKRIPLKDLRSNDAEKLTTEYTARIWASSGFNIQRWLLERWYRKMEGRQGMLWDKDDLRNNNYEIGTRLVDHFEVVEREVQRVIVRAGDSPLNPSPRASDGILAFEVKLDGDDAVFHFKSAFLNTTPEGAKAAPMPAVLQFLHREYTKLLIETSTRNMVK